MHFRHDLLNVAIVDHVDNGKTNLFDAMLQQQGAYESHQEVTERVMDSDDLEREKGITILAKNTAVRYRGPGAPDGGVTINIIDTPGHADFGGEVERGLSMVDAVILLVDASEGPLPQTRFVLRKALKAGMPVIVVINKVDRPDARISDVVDETFELFGDLLPDDADESALDFPIVYASAKAGRAGLDQPADGHLPDSANLVPMFQTILDTVPAPLYTERMPFQSHLICQVASLFLGPFGLIRGHEVTLRRCAHVAWCIRVGSIDRVKITALPMPVDLERAAAEVAAPGDIAAVAGI